MRTQASANVAMAKNATTASTTKRNASTSAQDVGSRAESSRVVYFFTQASYGVMGVL